MAENVIESQEGVNAMISAQALIDQFLFALANLWGYIWGTAGVLWTQARQDQKVKYMVDTYGTGWKNSSAAKKDKYYYAALYGSKWINHYVADCSGLFVWAFKQLSGKIAHSSNSIYKNYCTVKGQLSKGKRTDGQELRPATAVFTGTADSHGHIGLYIGDGRVIEASGTQVGVIESKVTDKKWTYWGELKSVSYDGAEPSGKPTIRKGDRGPYVALAQTELIQQGYSCGNKGADGIFGNDTLAAVKAFQQANGLDPDGVVGPLTWAALDSTERVLYTVTVPHLTLIQADELIAKYPGSQKTEEAR